MKNKHYEGSFCAFLFIAFLSITPFSHALEPSKEPMIRVETGMHTATITAIATDRENRYLVTASLDKTVRLWDASSGRLIRAFRPPIEDGDEGKLHAVTISPDGQTVACGGVTGQSWEGEIMYPSNIQGFGDQSGSPFRTSSASYIYVFNVQTGQLKKRIITLPGMIARLDYSEDNRYFFARITDASVFVGGGYLQGWHYGLDIVDVFRTGDYSRVRMTGYEGYCDFQSNLSIKKSDNKIITYSVFISKTADIKLSEIRPDGFFGQSMKVKAVMKLRSGTKAFSTQFSPDGSVIAVSYKDSHKVDVYSAKDLSHLYSPDTTGIGGGSLMALSWSSDGRYLYASGTYETNGQYMIRKWQDAGKGRYEDMPVSTTPITQFLSLKDGRIVFASAEPGLIIIDQDGNKIFNQRSAIANYRVKNGELLVSKDGTTIQFDYYDNGKTTSRFSINKRHFQTGALEESTAAFQKPIQSAAGIVIKDWRNSKEPKIELMDYQMSPPQGKNQKLSIGTDEISHNLAIAPDESAFILGTTRFLRLYDSRGNLQWKISVPEDLFVVNISGDSRIAVAAFADGIIRWYHMKDGEELFSLFPHRDKKRWAIWTASGYYDVNEGAGPA